MHTLFKRAVLYSIDEIGDVFLFRLIRDFLETEKRQKFTYPIQNPCYISDADFDELRNQVKELFDTFDIGLYKEIDSKSERWEDSWSLLSREETNKILDDKENWTGEKGKPVYTVATKDDYDEIPDYLYEVYKKKIRKHIEQIRGRYDNKVEVIPPFGKGGFESVTKIIGKALSKDKGQEATYAGLPAKLYNDGNLSFVYSPCDLAFWTIIKNPQI